MTGLERVRAALAQLGSDCQVVELPDSTRTAADAARAIGCTVAQIAKSIVFCASETARPVLVIASGVNRVNERRIAELVGQPIERATPDFVRERTGFAIGGVAPIGHATPPITFIDSDLAQFAEIWAAAGTPHAVFKTTSAELQRATGAGLFHIK